MHALRRMLLAWRGSFLAKLNVPCPDVRRCGTAFSFEFGSVSRNLPQMRNMSVCRKILILLSDTEIIVCKHLDLF